MAYGIYKKSASTYKDGVILLLENFGKLINGCSFKLACCELILDGDVANKMMLDINDSLRLSIKGIYEPFETELLKNQIGSGNTVLNIGANIGYYTLIFAKSVGSEGRVFAFEPDPTNFNLLKQNIALNGYQNVTLEQKAVYSANRTMELFLNEDNQSDHRIYQTKIHQPCVVVDAVSLDNYFRNGQTVIDLIKMDIQGAEMAALQGMARLLKKNRDVRLVMEFLPTALNRFGTDPKELLTFLSGMGFNFFNINEDKNRLESTDIFTLMEKYTPANGKCTNLLCKREI